MKALTVQQPWAWAIVHGGKDIENRTQTWGYRGPLAIHAGARHSETANDALTRALGDAMRADRWHNLTYSAVIGVVDLVDVHLAEPESETHPGSGLWAAACCESPWAEQTYTEHGGRERRQIVHLELAHPRPLADPIPCRGHLGLWTPPADVLDQITAQLDQRTDRRTA